MPRVVMLVVLLALSACSAEAPEPTSGAGTAASAPAPSATSLPAAPAPAVAAAPAETPVETPAAPDPGPASPLALPTAPVVVRTTPTGPPLPGTLQTVDWSAVTASDACAGARVDPPSYGDLNGDGRDEAAVPVVCTPDGSAAEVLVYTGEPAAPSLLGKALDAAERGRVHAVEFRDRRLVVTSLAHGPQSSSDEPDTAVTTRWVLDRGRLLETDRWTDPAYVLHIDDDH
jgi:hypothetical protein